jgi:hypothetical protein
MALEFVSSLLKTDYETVRAAVRQCPGAARFANPVIHGLLIKEVGNAQHFRVQPLGFPSNDNAHNKRHNSGVMKGQA